MSGILLIGVVLLWIWMAVVIGQMLTSKFKDSWIKSLVTFVVTAVLIPLPVADEIIGGFQFRALCNEEAVITYNKEKAYGKTVHLKKVDRFDLPKMVLPVRKEIWKYAEHISDEDLISYVDFYSDGGWLSRAINFNNVHRPYTFLGVCSGDKDDSVFQKLHIKNATNQIFFDQNTDGVKIVTGWVKSDDAQFANLRLWRDLNQDGVSQANELFTLGSQNIAAINVGSTAHSQILANGNQLADLGSYVKTDGSVATLGEVTGNLGDINLVQNTFLSQFVDHLDTSAVTSLPDMQGAGQVRSLREAATLSTTLAQLLSDFVAAGTYSARLALLDPILKAWSDTSTMATTFSGAYNGHALSVNMQGIAAGSAPYNAVVNELTILEHFNGRTFNAVPTGTAANDKTWRIAA